jgi:1-acyl-sn-glycerol-3-phosphate acyltransferase
MVHLLFRLQYEGIEHVPEAGPAILVSNHTSLMDMFAIHVRVRPWVHWVAKKELYRSKFMAGLLQRLGCIAVDRDKADLSAARGIVRSLKMKDIVGMFPQGTRVKPDQISQIKPRSGAVHFALRTGVPLLPVAIDGPFRLFGRVRIVYGAPYHLAGDRAAPDTRQIDELSLDMMRRIYNLIGKPYQLDPPVREANA